MKRIVILLLFGAIMIWYVFPLYWTVSIAFKPRIYVYDPSKFVFLPTLDGFRDALNAGLLSRLGTSAIVSLLTTCSALFIGSFAAYGITRSRNTFIKNLLVFFVVSRYFPPISLVFAFFVLSNIIKLFDTIWILIICYHLLAVTFTVLMMSGFLKTIPTELEEAAMVDGCSRLSAIFRVVLPLAAGGMFATGVFVFLYCWNEFTYAMFLTALRARTWPTLLSRFVGIRGVEWGPMTASATLAILPILVLAIFLRRYLVQGLTFGLLEGGK